MKKLFAMIAFVAMASGAVCACGSKVAINEEVTATDSATVAPAVAMSPATTPAAAPAANLPYAEQAKAAFEMITKAVADKNGDALVEGLKAYASSFGAAESMEEIEEVTSLYNVDKVLPGKKDMKAWVSAEQMQKIADVNLNAAKGRAMSRFMGSAGSADAQGAPSEK